MECDPTDRLDAVAVVKLARPFPSSVPVPIALAPSLKVTVPVGRPLPGAATVAVNVSTWLNTDGFDDEASDVVVDAVAGFTTCGDAESSPALPSHPPVPVKVALIVCVPTPRAAVLNAACPVASTATPLASAVPPSAKSTFPV